MMGMVEVMEVMVEVVTEMMWAAVVLVCGSAW